MDEKTLLAIIRRIDDAERRLGGRLEKLEAFRFQLIGGAVVVSGIVSLIAEVMRH